MATPSVYQRVGNAAVTPSDYDSSVGKVYLSFNGVNQWLQTNSIDFTYGDKMFVSAGVRKLSEGSYPLIVETSTNWGLNNGTFNLSQGNTNGYAFASKGTIGVVPIVTTPNSPVTNVLSGVSSISTPSAVLRLNGTQVAQDTTSQGTGNFGNYPLYIGARAGNSLWFNGRLYGLVVAGKQASTSEITSCERYLNQKTGAY